MYVTFKNIEENEKMIIFVENQKYIINPEESVEIFFKNKKIVFETQSSVFEELTDSLNELEEEMQSYSFKDRILAKLTKKLVNKLPEIALDLSIKYEAEFNDCENPTINLCGEAYSVCDGKFADMLDMMPVMYVFPRAETDCGNIKAADVTSTNLKQFLKLMRNLLLFKHWGWFFVELFFFIPEYLIIKFYSSHFYTKNLFCGFYNRTAAERARIFLEKEQFYEKDDEKSGCLSSLLKALPALLIIGAICFWGITSEPKVVVAEDFGSVTCFDETFIKINGGLPSDAEDVFLEDYSAYYTLPDGSYDTDNYYCYIYETPDGTRYMWLKDNCSNEENQSKDYEDYDNPLVYKSVGEKEQ